MSELSEVDIKKIKEENITLYAMWIQSEDTMQSWDGCAAMNIGDVKALTDNRDGNVYTYYDTPEFTKNKTTMTIEGRPTDKLGIIGQFQKCLKMAY